MMGGGDIVGILNSDDTYAESDIIEDVVETMIKAKVDSCYGDLANVDREETGKIIRYWRSDAYDRKRFKRGWMWWPRCPLIYGEFLSNTRANSLNRFPSPSLEKSSSPSAEGQTVCDVITATIQASIWIKWSR